MKYIILIVTSLILLSIAALYLPPGVDWSGVFRPAALELLRGNSPYDVAGFFYPVWAAFPLVPFALLPENWGRAAWLVTCLVLFAVTAVRLGARPVALIAFLVSPTVVHSLLNANIDALALVGAILPAPIGLFFVLIKPQMGVGIAAFWFIEATRQKRLIRTFAPVSLSLVFSFAVFGLPTDFFSPVGYPHNASLWPVSIPIGLVLLSFAIRKQRSPLALASGPTLSPYVLFHSWSASLVALAPYTIEMVLASLGLWVAVALRLVG